MIHFNPNHLYKPRLVLLWMILSLEAGYLNAAGFLATGNFVSHVTGFGTHMGISIAHDDYLFGIELLVIPLSFILGSSIPAWILDWKYSEFKLPKYHYVQFLITAFLGTLFLIGVLGGFGEFTTETQDIHDIILIGILCSICGMKNGLSTWSTNGKIRTTHLTGLATDIGLNLPKFFRHNVNCRFPEKRRVNSVRILTFFSFSVGSLISAFIFPRMDYRGFAFPFLLSFLLAVISYVSYMKKSAQLDNASKTK